MINCHVKLKIFEKKEKEKEGGGGGVNAKETFSRVIAKHCAKFIFIGHNDQVNICVI